MVLRYTDVQNMDGSSKSGSYQNLFIFDEYGSYGVVTKDLPSISMIHVHVLGIMSESVKNNFASETDDKVIGNYVIASDGQNLSIVLTFVDTLTGDTEERKYNVKSSDESVAFKVSGTKIDVTVNPDIIQKYANQISRVQ